MYTPAQRRAALEACSRLGSSEKAAEETGIPARTIRNWRGVTGTSTLYGPDGEVKLVWEKTRNDSMEALEEAVEAFKADLPRYKPVKAPRRCESDLCAVYPVGDHHIGMLAWEAETGENYDLDIAQNLLIGAVDHLVSSNFPCEQAVIIFLGDYLHYDGFEAVTPTSRNPLDTDSRFPKMIDVGVNLMRYCVNAALKRHKKVHVIAESGNHDIASTPWLAKILEVAYEREPRVTVDMSREHFHYFRFGKCLIGTHHGHGTKMANLPLIMATDRPEDWGQTEYRYMYTGHIHKSKVQPATSAQDFSGCVVESFRILPPNDAWAHQKGYRSHRDMKSITLHKDFGEVSRNTVNPKMLG